MKIIFDDEDITRINEVANLYYHEISEECKIWFGTANIELVEAMKIAILLKITQKVLTEKK